MQYGFHFFLISKIYIEYVTEIKSAMQLGVVGIFLHYQKIKSQFDVSSKFVIYL